MPINKEYANLHLLPMFQQKLLMVKKAIHGINQFTKETFHIKKGHAPMQNCLMTNSY